MRLALHFDEHAMNQPTNRFWEITKTLFSAMAELGKPEISTQIFTGTLLLHQYAYELQDENSSGRTERFNLEKFREIKILWAKRSKSLFCTFNKKTMDSVEKGEIVRNLSIEHRPSACVNSSCSI